MAWLALTAQPVVAGALDDIAGHTLIIKYDNAVTVENFLNHHEKETHTCKVESHFYFSTGRKLFVTVVYRKCSNSDSVRNEPDAKSGDFYDYSAGLRGKDEDGVPFTISQTATTITISVNGKDKPYVSDDKKYRSQRNSTYHLVFSINGSGCGLKRTNKKINEVWTDYSTLKEHYVETTTDRTTVTSCRIVEGKA